jgi:tetratricopeptide (TPR) repeat protein
MTSAKLSVIFLLPISLLSCSEKPDGNQAPREVLTGLDGKKYYRPERPDAQRKLDSAASRAAAELQRDSSEDAYIWYGRREAYRYDYRKAISIYTSALKKFPGSYKLLRHRGHRFITVREFDRAIQDLERAAEIMPKDSLEIEPDGLPNKLNIPLSTAQFNVYYHLGLAHYLQGDFSRAEKAYRACMKVSDNDDLVCATADWLYMTLRRQGKKPQADSLLRSVRSDMKIIENDSYLKRLLMYKGEVTPEKLLQVESDEQDPDLAIATQGYGVGNWYLYNGDTVRAISTFKKVTEGNHFSAFGFIAAEADLQKLR